MPEESTTPEKVELVQRVVDAVNARDFDAVQSAYTRRAVLEIWELDAATFEGRVAIRAFYEERAGTFPDCNQEAQEIRDLGDGVALAVIAQTGHPADSTGWVQQRYAAVATWADELGERQRNCFDIDEACAAAERLAKERP